MTTPVQEQEAIQPNRGRSARAPQAVPWQGWKDIGYRIFVGFNQNRIVLTSAGVTFFMLFALVPSLSLFVTSYGLLNDPAGVIGQLNLLNGVVPDSGLQIIRDQLVRLTSQDSRSLGITLVISLAVALWGASAGIKAMFDAMNVVYGEAEKRNFFSINFLALLFILGAIVLLVMMLGVVLVLPLVLRLFFVSKFEWLVQVGAYGLMLISLLVALSAIYRWGPSREKARWRWITPGSLFAAIGIMLMSGGYSWYAANFSNYDAAYGSLGALIGFLTWMWVSVIIVIVGGSLNSEIEHQTTVDTTTGEPEAMGERGAFVADTVGGRWPAHGGKAAEGHASDGQAVKG